MISGKHSHRLIVARAQRDEAARAHLRLELRVVARRARAALARIYGDRAEVSPTDRIMAATRSVLSHQGAEAIKIAGGAICAPDEEVVFTELDARMRITGVPTPGHGK